MQFSSLFLIASATALNGVYAGCYSGGESWGAEKGLAEQAVDGLCTIFTGDGFTAGQTKAACAPLSGDKKADFQVHWGGEGSQGLSYEECVLRLKNEINGCEHGGSTETNQWTFTSDPNAGTCPGAKRLPVKLQA
ncbi:hypothetical protein F4808DRAFT_267377 [Astrocystis sublimbata]|nr:hypothetical protein F4808DRAFT_267377 [Astrocystis sublimbata]